MAPRTLIVVPARGGSKGIPRKNISPIGGTTLITRVIDTARAAGCNARTVVSTDDEEIASSATQSGVDVIFREPALAADDVTLDPVVFDVVQKEEAAGRFYDFVVTLQPTSPFLRPSTLARVISRLSADEADTIITAIDDTHLCWEEHEGTLRPAYGRRVNRQFLPSRYRETGGIVATRREWVTIGSRFGPRVALEVVDSIEGLDIDQPEDWIFAEAALSRRRIAFITIGNEQNGLGHVTRTLNLLDCLHGHPTLVLCEPSQNLAIARLQSTFRRVEACEREAMLRRMLDWGAEVVVHDELETDPHLIAAEREAGLKVVVFEDSGPGMKAADLVINALFPAELTRPDMGHWFGPDVYDLREEFRRAERSEFHDVPRRVLLTFGGTDPAGLTSRVLEALVETCSLPITVVAGLGMRDHEVLAARIAELRSDECDVELLRDVPVMSDVMRKADIAFSSAGRTLYELAHMGVPTIVIRQNERELQHSFGAIENGFLDLGLHSEVSQEQICSAFTSLNTGTALRRALHKRMLTIDLTKGRDQVVRMILRL